ncbi:MAG: hypothetical protein JSU72_00845 [Deltaproteobacteria bacterium]|nr:MAG: hypothetical protein JSU72_00845 [Deltaproteobacteria bacterium]
MADSIHERASSENRDVGKHLNSPHGPAYDRLDKWSGLDRRKENERRSGENSRVGRYVRVFFEPKYLYVPESMDRRNGDDRRQSVL